MSGLDRAETMVTEATAHNAELVAAARASFRLGSAELIPCKDESFDRVFAVNVIYFWPEPVRALAEMRRVLRPGGLSIVAQHRDGTGRGSAALCEVGVTVSPAAAVRRCWRCIATQVSPTSWSTITVRRRRSRWIDPQAELRDHPGAALIYRDVLGQREPKS